jgi:uncharacterized protein YciI
MDLFLIAMLMLPGLALLGTIVMAVFWRSDAKPVSSRDKRRPGDAAQLEDVDERAPLPPSRQLTSGPTPPATKSPPVRGDNDQWRS